MNPCVGPRHRSWWRRASLALCSVVLAACAAPAGQAGDDGPLAAAGDAAAQVAFAYADRNADGRVSFEEYRNRSMRLFRNADLNRDGILQIAEQRAMLGPRADPASVTEDLSLQDFNAALVVFFRNADTDADGYLSPTEWRGIPRANR